MTDIHGLKPDVWPNTPYNVTAQIRGDIRQIVQREIEQVTIGTIGAETPAGAQAKVDTSAASLTAAIAAAKAELLAADALLAPLAHTHDDRYYLKAQVDASLAGKAAISHAHDDRYYTESEVDAALAGKAATSHSHNEQYYTEAEIDTALGEGEHQPHPRRPVLHRSSDERSARHEGKHQPYPRRSVLHRGRGDLCTGGQSAARSRPQ